MATLKAVDNPKTKSANREAIARTTLAVRMGRDVSDAEWTVYRARLLAYARLLKTWEEKGRFSLGSDDDLG
jgi:hypothetical protein